MSRYLKYLFLILFLIVAISLSIIFRSFLMTNLFEPAALLLWIFWRILSSIDQSLYWGTLIVLCTILVINLIPFGKRRHSRSKYDYNYEPPDQVGYWLKLLSSDSLNSYENDYLRVNLWKLLVAVYAKNERLNSKELTERLFLDDNLLSSEARSFLYSSRNKKQIFSFYLSGWLRKLVRISPYQEYALIDEIINLMEAELEISYEE